MYLLLVLGGAEIAAEAEDQEKDRTDDDQDKESPASPEDIKENIKSKFLVDMPQDFYDFWDLAKSIKGTAPQGERIFDERIIFSVAKWWRYVKKLYQKSK